MSFKGFCKPIPRLTGRKLWCNISDYVVYPIGSEKAGAPANLYENVIKYLLYQEFLIDLGAKSFSCKIL